MPKRTDFYDCFVPYVVFTRMRDGWYFIANSQELKDSFEANGWKYFPLIIAN